MKTLLPPFLAFLIPLAGWLAFHLLIHGKPLPTTFYVKAHDSSPWMAVSRDGLSAIWLHFIWYPLKQVLSFVSYIPFFNVFLCAGAGLALYRRETRRPAAILAGVIIFFGLARGLLGYAGPSLQHGRYYTFLYPLWAALSAAGLARVIPGKGRFSSLLPHLVLFTILLLLWLALPGSVGNGFRTLLLDDPSAHLTLEEAVRLAPGLNLTLAVTYLIYAGVTIRFPLRLAGLAPLAIIWATISIFIMADAYTRNVKETNQAHISMGKWVKENTPPGAVIACHDIGALGYFGERKILDLAGIATPEVLFWGKRLPNGKPDRTDYLRTRRPDYLCVLEGWYPEELKRLGQDCLAGRLSFAEVHHIHLPGTVTVGGEHYTLIKLTWREAK